MCTPDYYNGIRSKSECLSKKIHLNETSGTLKNKKFRNREKGDKNIGTDISEIGVPMIQPPNPQPPSTTR